MQRGHVAAGRVVLGALAGGLRALVHLRYVYEEILSLAELLNPRSLTSHGDVGADSKLSHRAD